MTFATTDYAEMLLRHATRVDALVHHAPQQSTCGAPSGTTLGAAEVLVF